MKKKLILIGTSTTAAHVLSFVNYYDLFEVVGFAVNEKFKTCDEFMDLPVYTVEQLPEIKGKVFDSVFVAMLWNHLNGDRKKVYEQVKSLGIECANLIAPTARIRGNISGDNCWIHDFVIVQNDAVIGNDVMIMANTMIGANAKVADHCFFGTKSTLGGQSSVGEQSFIGINSTVFDDTVIGKKCIVGACTFVKRNLPDFSVCKTKMESVTIKSYDEEIIEEKLMFRKNVR